MNRAEACAVLGCKDRELASIEDVDGEVVLITSDGQAYRLVDGKPVVCAPPEVDEAGELVVDEPAEPDPAPRRRRRVDG
jgi:hypothetical protein